jgi:hypothetical protein
MIVYEETIRLPRFLSVFRTIGYLSGTLFTAVFCWSEFRGKSFNVYSWPALIPLAFVLFETLPVLMILNAALFPEMMVQIDPTAVLLSRGFVRKKFQLASVVEVAAVSAPRVKKTTVLQYLYQNSDFLFLDRERSSNVELLLSGGISKYFATARPEELVKVLRFQIERARRETVLRMIAAENG